ncbi:ArsR/SmtB family transcription factor [Burkholderia vietnamiensis]|uniref:ArsR/SmtB family transcription factor n=1 Tax=Burkholderia vietnamiensis TaxID=60552 RepID=UPI001D144917|nr:helix-turn-helix transcriptional regulator [Burkholderia vietnamiensis]UEC01662.1 ArsR family transcriptional regulator [Burkholderia vietnamiensis]
MSTPLPQPHRHEIDLSDVFSALADPLRRTAIAALAALPEGIERNCASFGFPVPKASLTHHFKVLREAGLLQQVDLGNRKMSMLRRADIDQRFPGLLDALVRDFRCGVDRHSIYANVFYTTVEAIPEGA